MREAEEIRLGRSSNFQGIIDVSNVIAGGLQ
jgi:flagellar biosynthesis regulator FlaF